MAYTSAIALLNIFVKLVIVDKITDTEENKENKVKNEKVNMKRRRKQTSSTASTDMIEISHFYT